MTKKRLKKKPPKWAGHDDQTHILPLHLLIAEGQWFYVFNSLLALLVLYPYLESSSEIEMESPWLLSLNSIIVGIVIWAVSYNKRQFILALLLGLPAMAFSWFSCTQTVCSLPIEMLSLCFTFFFYVYAILLIIPHHLHTHEVTTDELYEVASLYLLVGLAWATLYQIVELWHPGSFSSTHLPPNTEIRWSDLLFFSFVTITTLGYGDITAVTSQARSLAILEVFTGVIFIAVVLARAIGLYTAHAILRRHIEETGENHKNHDKHKVTEHHSNSTKHPHHEPPLHH